jgi:hypothetical protein
MNLWKDQIQQQPALLHIQNGGSDRCFVEKRRDDNQPTAAFGLDVWKKGLDELQYESWYDKNFPMMTSTQKNRRYYQTRMTYPYDDDVVECT